MHRSLARECPLKAGGGGGEEGGQEAEPTLKIPRRCLLSPRCLAFSLFATVRSGQKRPALSSSSPSPSDSPRGRDEGGWRRRGTHRNANLYYPRERERERSLPLDGASTRADSPWDRVRASISRQTSGRLVVEMPTQCPILSLSNRRAPLGIWRSPFQPNGIPPLSLFPGCPPRPRFSPLIPPAEFFWGAGFFDRDVSKKSRRRCLFLLSRQLRDQPSPNRFDPMGGGRVSRRGVSLQEDWKTI